MEKMLEKHEVHVFTPKIKLQSVRERLIKMGVITYENSLDGSNISILSDLKFIIALFQLIKRLKPDVFFPFTLKPVIYGTPLARLCNVNLIAPMLTGLGYNFSDYHSGNKLIVKITRLLLKFSLRAHPYINIIFHNKDDSKKLLELKILNKKHKIFVVNGSGVDLHHYSYSKPLLKPVTFLMVSRLINAKGIREYYQAAKIIKSRFPDVVFKLIGLYDDNIDSISTELYIKIKAGDTLKYLGHVNDIRPAIQNASVLVLPSYNEGVPRCILEGMAMGRAVITCDSAGCRETVNQDPEKVNGFLIPVKDVSELAAKMEYFITHTQKIIDYGNKGREYASEKFDVNVVNASMLKIMQLNSFIGICWLLFLRS